METRTRVLCLLALLLLAACSPLAAAPVATATAPETATTEPSPAATSTPSPEQMAQAEGISIFDINSFPGQFRGLVKNPEALESATQAELRQYQRFIEAARAKFFEEQGIADEVAAIKGINPEHRSIWGVIYWMQSNREQAITGGIIPVLSPLELDAIKDEPTFQPWRQSVTLPSGTRAPFYYGRNLTDASGDIAFMGRLFADDPNTLVTILHMETPPEEIFPYAHVLYADVVVFDENFTLPAGTNCQAARVGQAVHAQSLPVDVHIGLPDDYSGRDVPITRETYIEAIGANVTISHLVGLSVDGNLAVTSCTHPDVDMGVETQFGSQKYFGSDRFSDWTSEGEWSWYIPRTE